MLTWIGTPLADVSDPFPLELVEGLAVAQGKYELVRCIGKGGMGQVWCARHRTLGGEFAIKFLDRKADDKEAEARLQFDAQVAAKVARRTRHIVAVHDHGEEGAHAYLVMELVNGETLENALRRTGPADVKMVCDVVAQVAKGLGAAHAEGVFHRDLKPANVLLTRDEDGALLAKILDFGIAKTARSHRLPNSTGMTTDVGVVLGTPSYMSPEQARGLASLDYRCDLWALGTIAYEALTGRLPSDGETTADLLVNICTSDHVPVRQWRPELPAAAEEFFARAFAPKLRDRFEDAQSMSAAFAASLAEVSGPSKPMAFVPATEGALPDPVEAEGVAADEHHTTSRNRRRGPKLVGFAVLAVAMLGGIALGVSRLTRARHSEGAQDSPTQTAEPNKVTPPSDPPAASAAKSVEATSQPTKAAPQATIAKTGAPPPFITVAPPVTGAPTTTAPPVPSPTPAPTPSATPEPPPTSAPTPAPTKSSKPLDKGEIL